MCNVEKISYGFLRDVSGNVNVESLGVKMWSLKLYLPYNFLLEVLCASYIIVLYYFT